MPENSERALQCLNHLVANALEHVPEVFTYMARLQNGSVFNFCAIPQVMAIATLALCYNNKNVFAKNVKIRKGQAVQMMLRATSMGELYAIFEDFALELKAKVRSFAVLSVFYWGAYTAIFLRPPRKTSGPTQLWTRSWC